jgi:hypothetical protein
VEPSPKHLPNILNKYITKNLQKPLLLSMG